MAVKSKAIKRPTLPKALNPATKRAVVNDFVRKTHPNSQVAPWMIPFTGSNYYGPKDSKGRKQHLIPVRAGQVMKIPILCPEDSLFHMIDIRYMAYQASQVGDIQTTPTNVIRRRGILYDRFRLGGVRSYNDILSQTLGSATITPSGTAVMQSLWRGNSVRNLANRFIIYDVAKATHAQGVASGLGASKQEVYVDTVNPGTLVLNNMDGTAYSASYTGSVWVEAPEPLRNPDIFEEFTKYLKVALYAKSPGDVGLYGNSANVTGVYDENPFPGVHVFKAFPHIERLWVHSIQGNRQGRNQVRHEYLFPMDGTILIEIENKSNGVLYVNGVISGYRYYQLEKEAAA